MAAIHRDRDQSARRRQLDAAAILAAARQMGCKTVHSEELNNEHDYGGVRVENPFGYLGRSSQL